MYYTSETKLIKETQKSKKNHVSEIPRGFLTLEMHDYQMITYYLCEKAFCQLRI